MAQDANHTTGRESAPTIHVIRGMPERARGSSTLVT
jgi:hypothetical protein